MSAETRLYPRTTYTRKAALDTAKQKNDSLTGESPLTPKTIERLNAICALLDERTIELRAATGNWAMQAEVKAKAKNKTVMLCSHFIQVFDLGVKRGVFGLTDRVYFGLHENSTKLPRMIQDMEILMVAENLIRGDAKRVENGGAPVSCPTIAEVQAVYSEFKTAYLNMSNHHSRLSIKQKAVNELTKEVRGVLRKVWDEIETFYDDLPREGMRSHGRRWGIVYIQKGGEKFVEGTVTHAQTGLPLAGVSIKLLNGRNKVATNAQGKFKINTTLMHTQPLLAKLPGYTDVETMIELQEGKTCACNLVMQ